MQEGNWRTRERLQKQATFDWKPNAHKCQDGESNFGLFGAKREITLIF